MVLNKISQKRTEFRHGSATGSRPKVLIIDRAYFVDLKKEVEYETDKKDKEIDRLKKEGEIQLAEKMKFRRDQCYNRFKKKNIYQNMKIVITDKSGVCEVF